MHVIAIVAKKGGVGKTSLSLNFGVAAELKKKRVAVLDMDEQQSTTAWSVKYRNMDDGPVFRPSEATDLARQLSILRNHDIDYVFIDTPPEDPATSKPVSAAVNAASLVLVPFTPQILAVEATDTTAKALRKSGKNCLIVINIGPLPHHKRAVEDVLSAAEVYGLPICPHILARRQDIETAQRRGLGILEYDPKCEAAKELKKVFAFVDKRVKEQLSNIASK